MDASSQNGKQLRYDGLVGPKEFLKALSLQALMYKWTDDVQATAIALILTGKAERVYEAMTGDKTMIDVIKKALEDGCTETKEVFLRQFQTARPKPGELLSTYAVRLQELLTKALPNLKGLEMSIMLRGQLANHLPDYMKALITFHQKTSWDDLLAALDSAHPYVSKMFDNSTATHEYLDVNTMNSSTREGRRCHTCNEVGHLMRNCPRRKNRNEMNRQQNRSFDAEKESNQCSGRKSNGYSSYNKSSKYQQKSNHQKSQDRDTSNKSDYHKNKGHASYTMTADNDSSCDENENLFSNLSLNVLDIKQQNGTVNDNKLDLNTNSITLDLNTILSKAQLLKRSINFAIAEGTQRCKLRALFD
jgi:hypothetical protein